MSTWLFILVLGYSSNEVYGASLLTTNPKQKQSCENWVLYGSEKCLHIVDSAVFQTKQEAEVVCQSLAEVMELDDIPRVVTVRTKTEQKQLQQFLFEDVGLLEPVWLGLDREDDGVVRWNDGAKVKFENLAKQNISAADRPCTQMESGQGMYPMGQWARVNCRKRNVVVCEKIQVWTVAKLQRSFLNLKSEIDSTENQLLNAVGRTSHTPIGSSDKSINNMPCGNWIPFKNEKCVKFVSVSGFQTKDEAEAVCRNFVEDFREDDTPKLVTVMTEEKQRFLQKFLSTEMGTLDAVWLGLDLEKDDVFKWNDGTGLFFTNWAEEVTGTALMEHERNCVQMELGGGVYEIGKWVRAPCKKKNAVVCERTQTWKLNELQNIVLSLKLELEKNKREMELKIAKAKSESKQFIDETKKEAEQRLNKSKQEAQQTLKEENILSEKKLSEAKKETEQKLNALKQEIQQQLRDTNQNIIELNNEAEQILNKVKQETQQKLNELNSQMQQKLNEADQKMAQVKIEGDRKVQEAKNAFEERINQQFGAANKEIAGLKQNLVPIGFVYVQLPGQDPPTTFWPKVTWRDVSKDYAGLFFRVEGGDAAPFGQEQQDNTRRLVGVFNREGWDTHLIDPLPVDGEWSKKLFSGKNVDPGVGLSYRFTTGEIRPRNKAVKIWKRVN